MMPLGLCPIRPLRAIPFSDFVLAEAAAVLQSQTITFGALAAKCSNDAAFNLTATASSGLAVTYMSSNTSVATVLGNTVTIVGAGTSVITASQAGNTSYSAAPDVVQTLTVNAAPVVAAIAGTANVCIGATRILTNATNGGTWSSSDMTKATVATNGVVTGVAAGATTISYTVTSNGCTTVVTQAFTVNNRPTAGSCNQVNDPCQTNSGAIEIKASNGTAPYTVSWTNTTPQNTTIGASGGTATITGLRGGVSYTFTITDANGCIAQ
jgi:succinate dehydrogenase/fumarate reductase cytochrome b subunit